MHMDKVAVYLSFGPHLIPYTPASQQWTDLYYDNCVVWNAFSH